MFPKNNFSVYFSLSELSHSGDFHIKVSRAFVKALTH